MLRHIDDKPTNNLAPPTQDVIAKTSETASLDELVHRVCNAHAGLLSAFSNAIEHAIDIGQALIAAKELTPHGQWADFITRCDIGERQAERYMRLARLLEANPTSKSDLSGLSIEAAIKKLSPPTPRAGASPTKPEKSNGASITTRPASHTDILEVWLRAPPAEQERAIHGMGVQGWLDAAPKHWWPQIAQLLVDRSRPSTAVAATEPALMPPDDLSIPEFMRRNNPTATDC